MAKNYFAILEITSNATPNEVHSAYRRLAKEYHPDHYRGGSEPFKQIQEAYSILGNAIKRKAYEERLTKVRVRKAPDIRPKVAPEPLIPESAPADMGEISPIRSFETFSPSFDEIYDWLWNNFSTVDNPKSGRVQNLTLEVPLTREQARRGGMRELWFRPVQFVRRVGDMGGLDTMNAIDVRVRGQYRAKCRYQSRFLRVCRMTTL